MDVAFDSVLAKYDGLLLDLDGVLYLGREAIPFAAEAVKQAEARGCAAAYVTNNASRSPTEIASQLMSYGITCQPDQVLTSAQVAVEWLTENYPECRRVLAVGGPGLREALNDCGLTVSGRFEDVEQVVVQGFGPDVSWRDLAQASYALRAGCTWVATNLDLTVPTSEGEALGNGSLVAALTAATGRMPDVSTGKPAAAPFLTAAARLKSDRPLVVGDRLDTDIAGGVAAGFDSLLVLTGVGTVHDLLEAPPTLRPTHVGADLRGIFAPAAPLTARPKVTLRGWSCDERIADGHVEITLSGHGDWLDGVRAVAMSTWWVRDAGQSATYDAALDHACEIGSRRADL